MSYKFPKAVKRKFYIQKQQEINAKNQYLETVNSSSILAERAYSIVPTQTEQWQYLCFKFCSPLVKKILNHDYKIINTLFF